MTWCIVDAVNLLRARVKVLSIKATNLLRLKALFLMAAGALTTDNRPIYFYDLTAFYGDKTEWRFEIFRERQFPSFKSNTLHKYEKRPIRNFLCFTKISDRHLKDICCWWKKERFLISVCTIFGAHNIWKVSRAWNLVLAISQQWCHSAAR